MKCISCEIEINPQWKHAIDQNICPFCGKCILEEHLKNLFTVLRETMEKLQDYPEQLNDWMLSNHNYIKTDSPDIKLYCPKEFLKGPVKDMPDDNKKFVVKVKTDTGEQEVVAEKIQSEEKTEKFFKRAEVVKPNIDGFQSAAEKTKHLKEMAQQIKKVGSAAVNESGIGGMISPEMMENADPEAVAEYQSILSSGPAGEVSSSLGSGDDDDEVPDFVLNANMSIAASKGQGGTANAKDLMKLQQLQNRVNASKKSFESGADRSKGGFSRS